MTRTESQARTRDQLLTTAQRLFLSEGYGRTSLEQVAAEAGYSKGAVYSNFGNKFDLCLAVVDRVRAQQAGAIAAELGSAATPAELLAGLRRWAERHLGDEPWTALEVELATAARGDARVRAEIARRRDEIVDALTGLVESLAAQHEVPLPLPARDAAVMGLSLGIGLGVQRAVDPTVSVSPLVDFLALVLGLSGSP